MTSPSLPSHNLQVYRYEHGDGVGNALDLILQGYTHAIAMAAVPVVMCAGVLYLLVRLKADLHVLFDSFLDNLERSFEELVGPFKLPLT